jgi:hypothetical protein
MKPADAVEQAASGARPTFTPEAVTVGTTITTLHSPADMTRRGPKPMTLQMGGV